MHLLGCLIATFDGETEVGTIEAGDEFPRLVELELLDDVLTGNLVGGSREGHDGCIGEFFPENAQLRIFRAEIMSPLTDTMGFIDGKE